MTVWYGYQTNVNNLVFTLLTDGEVYNDDVQHRKL